MKQVIKLTESELHKIVKQVITEALNEITISQASVGGIYNNLSMNDINNGNSTVTFGSGRKSSVNRLEKSNEIEWELLSKAIVDSMGSFNFYFVQPDGGIGNKVITLGFESILYLGNNGFILYGNGKVSGKKVSRGKYIDDFRKIKIFYNANSKTYSWVNTYKVNSQKYIRATRKCDLILPKGDSHEMLENKTNEEHLFAKLNEYIDTVNSSLSPDLKLKIKL